MLTIVPERPSSLVFTVFLTLSASGLAAVEPPAGDGWTHRLEDAVARARQDDKLIVVDLWADWCTWCKKLDEEVFTTAEFERWARDYVLLRVNTEDGAEGTRLQEDFGVTGLPTTLIISPDRVRVGMLQGFSPAATYIQNLELERAMYGLMVRSYDDVDDTTDLETVRTLATDFHERRDGAPAPQMFERLLQSGEESAEDAAWDRYYYADSLRLHGDFEAAGAAVARARASAREAGQEDVLELVDLLPYHIARDRALCGAAETALERYLAMHPEGLYIETAEEALDSIRQTQSCA